MFEHYDHKQIESKWLESFLTNKIFQTKINKNNEVFSIALPPPNVTGELHMGHALGGTIQDVLIRYHRMKGFDVLWQIGTDHAGIGTQLVVEKFLKNTENKTKYQIGREAFVAKIQEWKLEYGNKIISQMQRLGFSADYDRVRYTMDDHYANGVLQAFIRYFDDSLIYRGKRITNWCPKCLTSLSDLELQKKENKKQLYKIAYRIIGHNQELIVSTSRPETMFGDVAVAINPKDTRYQTLITKVLAGEKILLEIPLTHIQIPLILDEAVKLDFGTGALKVTPAHDENDFCIAQRHQLPNLVVMTENAKMKSIPEVPEIFHNLDRFHVRREIVEKLQLEFDVYVGEDILHDRCSTEIEPYLSNQWYLSMSKLAKVALEAHSSGRVEFVPERYSSIFTNWLTSLQDWCISRQIWWGHRIPVFYYEDNGIETSDKFFVNEDGIKIRYYAALEPRSKEHLQDEDVLDTWFSSALWPFLSMQDSRDVFEHFYPSSVLATAREIINLWVTRMIFSSEYFCAKEPFSKVLIHPVVQTPDGKRMSKSKGNAIDSLDIVEKYGADASRMWYASVGIYGQQDIKFPGRKDKDSYSSDTIEQYKKFANKIFNAFKFVLNKLGDDFKFQPFAIEDIDNQFDQWVLYKFNLALKNIAKAFADYDLNLVQKTVYEFLWFDFCDWYIEFVKIEPSRNHKNILYYILEASLKALNPIMPFLTEELWQVLKSKYGSNFAYACLAEYPTVKDEFLNFDTTIINSLINIISGLRNLRQSLGLAWTQNIDLYFNKDTELLQYSGLLCKLLKINRIAITNLNLNPSQKLILDDLQITVPLQGLVDIQKLEANIQEKKNKLLKDIDVLDKRLSSPDFMNNAKAQNIEETKLLRDEIFKQINVYEQDLTCLQND